MKTIILAFAATFSLISCKKENTDPISEPENPIAVDTITFEIDLNLINSIDYSHDNSNLRVYLKEVGANIESVQTLSGADIGVVGQNYFSQRMKVNKQYSVRVMDLSDSTYSIWQGDTIYTYSTLISTSIQITPESWGYSSTGYYANGWVSLINFAGQTDQNGTPTAGPFRIQLKI